MTPKKRCPSFLILWMLCIDFKGGFMTPRKTKLHCSLKSMDLMVELSSNRSFQLNLINSTCQAARLNNTHVLLRTPLTDCGTKYKFSGRRVVFFNWLIIRKSDQSQTSDRPRAYQHSIPFHCVYKKKDIEFLRVVKPLNLDESKSSPREIISLLGLPVKIQCTFRNGASPITVKFFKNEIMVAKAKSPSMQRAIAIATKEDFGEYKCIAIDREERTAKHVVTVKQLDHSSVLRDGVNTTCSEKSFHVVVNRTMYPWLQPSLKHLHLRDHACVPRYINSTHILLNSSYDQCQTIKKESYRELIYDNVFVVHVKPRDGLPVVDMPDIEFSIECRLKKIPKSRITVTPMDQGKLYYFNGELFGIFHHGGTVRVLCETDPYEKFVAWRLKVGQPESPRNKKKMLLVENITDDDGGIYVCITTRRHLRLHFFVEAHSYAKTNQYVGMGKDGVLVCSVGGFPKVTKTWKKHGVKIELKGRHSIDKDGNLMIAEVRREDSGMYACEITQVFQEPFRMRTFQEVDIMVEVYEPLVIDRRRTSRKNILTLKGLKTNIICSFKHGATPLSITLTKNGQNIKTNGSVVTVKGRTLHALIETTKSSSFGKYECVAKDAVGRKIEYVINLRKMGKDDNLKNGITLNCHENFMDLTFNLLEYPFLDRNNYHIHLKYSACEPYEFTNTHIRIQAPLTGCGTTVKQHGNMATYYNTLVAHLSKEKQQNTLINRIPDLVFPFECAYETKIIKKKDSLVPVDSLKVNALRSSPLYVSSLLNMRSRLTCAFTGGALPLKITMTKHGRRVVEAKKIGDKTLTAVVWTRFSAIGKYKCKAVDEAGRKARHEITLGVTDWKKIPKEGISVRCDSHSLSVTLDRRILSWIQPEFLSIHLLDQTCRPYFTDSIRVFIKTQLTRCGTSNTKGHNHMVYQNKLIISERTEIYQVITWSPVIVIPIECKVYKSV